MLEKDPRKRPSAVAILQEPFLRQRMEVSSSSVTSEIFIISLYLCQSLQATQLTTATLPSSKEEAQAIAKAL